jgi:MoxR-like ATPase
MKSLPAPIDDAKTPSGLLRRLGFVGLDALEVPILAALVTGDPLLLVGQPGTAKTAVARAVAGAIGIPFWAYDASKSLFEDVIGFPDPFSLRRGTVSYASTPLSIWDKHFILVDELARANPAMQNKWLELIRSRTIMGRRVDGLKYVFAATNPLGHVGTQPLDAALTGRFAWIVRVPDAVSMVDADLEALVHRATEEDAPLAREAFPTTAAAFQGHSLCATVDAARASLPSLVRTQGDMIGQYVAELAAELARSGPRLDGRRLGMMRRNILSAMAVTDARDIASGGEMHERLVESVVQMSVPRGIQEDEVEATALAAVHHLAYRSVFQGTRSATGPATRRVLQGEGDLADRYSRAREAGENLDDREILSRAVALSERGSEENRASGLVTLLRVARSMAEGGVASSPDTVARALSAAWDAAGYDQMSVGDLVEILGETGANADEPLDSVAVRAASRWFRDGDGDCDPDRRRENAPRLVRHLRTLAGKERS